MSKILNNDPNTLLVQCDCHSHVLEVAFADFDGPEFYFSVWNHTPAPHCFSNRLKLIWRLICGKNLNGGDVIVELSDAIVISKFLTEKIKENEVWLEQQKTKKQTHGK